MTAEARETMGWIAIGCTVALLGIGIIAALPALPDVYWLVRDWLDAFRERP